MWDFLCGFPDIWGYFVGGPYNKDYHILVSILGSPYSGKLPCRVLGFGVQGIGF